MTDICLQVRCAHYLEEDVRVEQLRATFVAPEPSTESVTVASRASSQSRWFALAYGCVYN